MKLEHFKGTLYEGFLENPEAFYENCNELAGLYWATTL